MLELNPGVLAIATTRHGVKGDSRTLILVTTMNQARVGDVVTAKGIVRVDKDFGAGYSYKVLIEEAALSAN